MVEGNVPGIGAYPRRSTTRRPRRACRRATALSSATGPDYNQQYLGFEVQATKRLSNNWMARIGFSTNRTPSTSAARGGIQDPGASTTWPNIEGGAFVTGTSGSGKSEIYLILPRYQLTASGLYQFAYGINVAASLEVARGLRHAVLRAG